MYLVSLNVDHPGVEVIGSRIGVIVKVGGGSVLVGVVLQTGTNSSLLS